MKLGIITTTAAYIVQPLFDTFFIKLPSLQPFA